MDGFYAHCLFELMHNVLVSKNFSSHVEMFSCLRGYKTFFVLNSTEHEISTAHKNVITDKLRSVFALSLSDVVFNMLANDCWHFNIYEQDKFRAQLS